MNRLMVLQPMDFHCGVPWVCVELLSKFLMKETMSPLRVEQFAETEEYFGEDSSLSDELVFVLATLLLDVADHLD